jgi:hypothetical protein
MVRNKLCGHWNVVGDQRLHSHGPKQTLLGYCYDDRSGHSCEASTINLNVVIDAHRELSGRYGLNLRRRRGFSIVVTGYRHPKVRRFPVASLADKVDPDSTEPSCDNASEFTCPNNDFSVHDATPHCIWKELLCDTHQNCGFTFNEDEKNCSSHLAWDGPAGLDSTPWWSFSTMSLLIVTYLAIILVLVLVTMLFLRWHKGLTAATTNGEGGNEVNELSSEADLADVVVAEAASRGVLGENRLTTLSTGTPGISILVIYKPRPTYEAPPSYDTLFSAEGTTATPVAEHPITSGESPPNYSMIAVNLPTNPEERRAALSNPEWPARAIAEALSANPASSLFLPMASSEEQESSMQQHYQLVQPAAAAATAAHQESLAPLTPTNNENVVHPDRGQEEDQELVPLTRQESSSPEVTEPVSAATATTSIDACAEGPSSVDCECACDHSDMK